MAAKLASRTSRRQGQRPRVPEFGDHRFEELAADARAPVVAAKRKGFKLLNYGSRQGGEPNDLFIYSPIEQQPLDLGDADHAEKEAGGGQVEQVEAAGAGEVVPAEDILEENRPHALEDMRAGKAKSDMPQPDGQDVHRIADGRNRGHQKYAEPGEAFRSETETGRDSPSEADTRP